uniref:Peptidase S1 domain-containing protein n=1 Tax=Neogobius melanostomus TaxID=47308 RepID=A0A8C6T2I2_9GOBI
CFYSTDLLLISFVIGSLIVNGSKVKDDDAMQYMVSVQARQSHKCSGFLVSENFVLTAACCSHYLDAVVLGSHNLDSSNKQKITIEKKIMPKENDLMMLKYLKKKAKLGKGVEIIQLPNENTKVEAGDWCEIAGWGAIEIGKNHVKDLYATNVSIIDRPTCMKVWHKLPANVICAGDWGGPLVCNNTAVGIASFNRDGTIEGPNVFIDISKYLQWINDTKIGS